MSGVEMTGKTHAYFNVNKMLIDVRQIFQNEKTKLIKWVDFRRN